jgi:hypothetical protein
MTWVYVILMLTSAYLIGLGIGIVKKHSEKYFIMDFLIGCSIVIIINLIFIITNT